MPSANSAMTGVSVSHPLPTVTAGDPKDRAQPWTELCPERHRDLPDHRSFPAIANKGPRHDIRLLQEIDAKSR